MRHDCQEGIEAVDRGSREVLANLKLARYLCETVVVFFSVRENNQRENNDVVFSSKNVFMFYALELISSK